MVTFVLVEGVLIVFLIKYRHRPEKKKATFTHGNTRLEMCWTLAPAVILACLALASKRVWDRYQFPTPESQANAARVMVIGQQFKWNVIYPGPDGKFGRYLIFPKPTDMKWPDGKKFDGVEGPGYLPYADAVQAIRKYVDQNNPLGKDFNDPDGKDDDWTKTPGREVNIPANRPVEIHLSSRDVLHDFFLPNFRVKLDAVPGMRGLIHFTATKTSKEREDETLKTYTLDELAAALQRPETKELTLRIDENSPGAPEAKDKDKTGWRYIDPKDTKKTKSSLIRSGFPLPAAGAARDALFDKLRAAGITEVRAYVPGYFDIVCEELCGQGHYTMQGRLVVLDQDEYKQKYETPKGGKVAIGN
jgi:heme/copper-type cytochrome/quinol oxidase subunit 2